MTRLPRDRPLKQRGHSSERPAPTCRAPAVPAVPAESSDRATTPEPRATPTATDSRWHGHGCGPIGSFPLATRGAHITQSPGRFDDHPGVLRVHEHSKPFGFDVLRRVHIAVVVRAARAARPLGVVESQFSVHLVTHVAHRARGEVPRHLDEGPSVPSALVLELTKQLPIDASSRARFKPDFTFTPVPGHGFVPFADFVISFTPRVSAHTTKQTRRSGDPADSSHRAMCAARDVRRRQPASRRAGGRAER